MTMFEQQSLDKRLGSLHLSNRQRDDIEQFMKYFPTRAKLLSFFVPAEWERCLDNIQSCITCPAPTLARLNTLYDSPRIAQEIIATQITGIYSLSGYATRDPLREDALNLVAGLFYAQHGKQCTPYDLMLYFAQYMGLFKQTKMSFDTQDILTGFDRYRAWRQSYALPKEEEKKPQAPTGNVGQAALLDVVVKWMRQGESDAQIKGHPLYTYKFLNNETIRQAREIVTGVQF